MLRSGIAVLCIGLISGCASYEPAPQPKRLEFNPTKPARFKSEEERRTAEEIARAKCRAYAMQVAAGVSTPMVPPQHQVNINVQTAPVLGPAPLPSVRYPDSSTMINAYQAGAAVRLRDDVYLSSAIGCMAQEGWLVRE